MYRLAKIPVVKIVIIPLSSNNSARMNGMYTVRREREKEGITTSHKENKKAMLVFVQIIIYRGRKSKTSPKGLGFE
jgi:hypothetical protein